ncbi:MAG: PIG-L family deacetylase [Bryobacteraceae bacterium]
MRAILLLAALLPAAAADKPVVLVVTADASNYLLTAGGTIAGMADRGATVYLIRVTNDDKDSYDLPPEETALRTRMESEQAAKMLGVREVISMGYRASELHDASFTGIRDRLMFYIRHYKPAIVFIPNPYTEHDRVLDRYYTGSAAEDAWRAAALENYLPAAMDVGLKPHLTPELYYYAEPFDPRRREPESTETFVPQPKTVDISETIDKKIRAAQALKTINYSMAKRLHDRLTATQRKLRLLEPFDETAVNRLVDLNVRGLAKIAAEGTPYKAAEEFRHAGVEFRIPRKYRR